MVSPETDGAWTADPFKATGLRHSSAPVRASNAYTRPSPEPRYRRSSRTARSLGPSTREADAHSSLPSARDNAWITPSPSATWTRPAATNGPCMGPASRERPALGSVLHRQGVDHTVIRGHDDEPACDRDRTRYPGTFADLPANGRVADRAIHGNAGPARISPEPRPLIDRRLRSQDGEDCAHRDTQTEQEQEPDKGELQPRNADGDVRSDPHRRFSQDRHPPRRGPGRGRDRDDLICEVLRHAGRLVGHPVGDHPFEPELLAHAGRSVTA